MDKFKVWSIDWVETIDDAEEVTAYGPSDAVEEWCKWTEKNGNFADGFPDNHVVAVLDADGQQHRYRIVTEFEPQYYIFEKPQP